MRMEEERPAKQDLNKGVRGRRSSGSAWIWVVKREQMEISNSNRVTKIRRNEDKFVVTMNL